jgi:hypothetical protein
MQRLLVVPVMQSWEQQGVTPKQISPLRRQQAHAPGMRTLPPVQGGTHAPPHASVPSGQPHCALRQIGRWLSGHCAGGQTVVWHCASKSHGLLSVRATQKSAPPPVFGWQMPEQQSSPGPHSAPVWQHEHVTGLTIASPMHPGTHAPLHNTRSPEHRHTPSTHVPPGQPGRQRRFFLLLRFFLASVAWLVMAKTTTAASSRRREEVDGSERTNSSKR